MKMNREEAANFLLKRWLYLYQKDKEKGEDCWLVSTAIARLQERVNQGDFINQEDKDV